MKLSDRHNPSECKHKENRIFQFYEPQFNLALKEIGPARVENETLSKAEFNYKLTQQEKNILGKIYVPFGEIPNVKKDKITELFGDGSYEKLNIGIEEKRLLDFILDGNHNHVQLIVAPVGWGKSTLIYHSMFYVLQQSEKTKKKFIPIYLSSKDIKHYISDLSDNRVIKKAIKKRLLKHKLQKISNEFAKLNDEQFWSSLVKDSDEFFTLVQDEEDFNQLYPNNKNKVKELVGKSRRKARKHENFQLHLIRTIQNKDKKQFVFIFDDFDTLNIKIQEQIIDEAIYMAQHFDIKVVVCLRSNVYKELRNIVGGTLSQDCPETLFPNRLDIIEYLKRRMDYAFTQIDAEKFVYNIDDENIKARITQEDGKRLIRNMTDILLNKTSSDFLGYVSYFNLKRINDFCRSYLSNGFIENSQFYLDVIQKNFEKKADLKQPFWILLSSVITSNYETIFSAFDRMPPELVSKYVLNLFCNSKDGSEKYSCQKLFVRAHLLNYMYRFREVSYQELKATYYKLINDCKEEFFDKSFNRCIYRFLETNILVSPEVYIPNKVDSVANVRNLTITETGRYYLDTFSSYFEYSMYLKDDVDLPPNINILSCVQEPDRKKQFENEVLKFFTFLTNEEMKFISELDKSQRKILLDKFSSPIPQTQNSPIISQFPLNRIREYGEKIGYKTEGYINLEKEIAKFVADMM